MKATVPNSAALLAKAKELAPFFTAQAPLNEAQGRLTDDTVAALRDNGFLGLFMPKVFGGAEVSATEGLEVIEAVAYGDGSTGWVLMAWEVAMATGAAYLPASGANKVFGDAMRIVAGQGAPNGKAEAVPGGYRLTGRWFYGSGLLHADYIHTGGVVTENGEPRMMPGTKNPDIRIFVVPVSEAKFLGNWDTLGLRATGSIDYSLTDVFVPEDFTHIQSSKLPVQGGGLYRLGIQGLGAACHTAFALGVGRRMLDELNGLATGGEGKPFVLSSGGGTESFQEQYATAEARYRAARAFVYETWREIEPRLDSDQEPTVRHTTLARLAMNYATSEVAEICTFAHKFGGGHSLRNTTMQRCLRDIHSGTQHSTQSPLILREAGRELLGLGKGKVWGFRGLIDP